MGGGHSHHYHEVRYVPPPNFHATVNNLKTQIKQEQAKFQNPEEVQKTIKKTQNLFIENVTKKKFNSPLTPEQRVKNNICFLAPTSCGKSTLINNLFNCNLMTGLGSTTKEATVAKEISDRVFWDAPGINSDFGFYKPQHLGFFQSLHTVVILFDRDVDDVHLIVDLISKMVPNVIYARTKCDLWKTGMGKTIDQQLRLDMIEIQKYDPKCREVIPIGFGMYDKIKSRLNLQ